MKIIAMFQVPQIQLGTDHEENGGAGGWPQKYMREHKDKREQKKRRNH